MAVAQAKRTHCPAGHPYDEANTVYSCGRRHCRACGKARYDAKRALNPLPTREQKILALVDKRKVNECWPWLGSMHPAGYGQFGKPTRMAHRIIFEMLVGPIPAGLTLDHLCRNRGCVNPRHLEPVTIAENVMRGEGFAAVNARKMRCPHGHPYDIENTYIHPKTGHRACRACNRERYRLRQGGDAQ